MADGRRPEREQEPMANSVWHETEMERYCYTDKLHALRSVHALREYAINCCSISVGVRSIN